MDDVGGEPIIREFAVEDCFESAWVSINEAVGIEHCFDLNFVVAASRLELEHAEDVVVVHLVGEIPEPEGSGHGFDISG